MKSLLNILSAIYLVLLLSGIISLVLIGLKLF